MSPPSATSWWSAASRSPSPEEALPDARRSRGPGTPSVGSDPSPDVQRAVVAARYRCTMRQHLLLVGIDGLRLDVLAPARIPHLSALMDASSAVGSRLDAIPGPLTGAWAADPSRTTFAAASWPALVDPAGVGPVIATGRAPVQRRASGAIRIRREVALVRADLRREGAGQRVLQRRGRPAPRARPRRSAPAPRPPTAPAAARPARGTGPALAAPRAHRHGPHAAVVPGGP